MQRLQTMQKIHQDLPTSADFAEIFSYLSDGALWKDDKKTRTILLQTPDYTLEKVYCGIFTHQERESWSVHTTQ
jgi:hypothetical protein